MQPENGRVAHAEMQFHLISRPAGTSGPDGYDRGTGPSLGSLPPRNEGCSLRHLPTGPGTPGRCWFCLWEGFGGVDDDGVSERVKLQQRNYLLFRPTLDAVQENLNPPWDQSPNLWWPDDRTWVVGTEVDLAWTYVGGSRRLIDTLLLDGRLEVLEAGVTDRIGYGSDLLNDALSAD